MRVFANRTGKQSFVLKNSIKASNQRSIFNILQQRKKSNKKIASNYCLTNVCQCAHVANINCPSWGDSTALGNAIHARIQSLFLANAANGRVEISHATPYQHRHDIGDRIGAQYRYGELKPNNATGILDGQNQIGHHALVGRVTNLAYLTNLQFPLNEVDPQASIVGNNHPHLRLQENQAGLFVYDGQ